MKLDENGMITDLPDDIANAIINGDGRTEKKMMYLVTFDPYHGYGAYIYALGVYSSKDAAEKAVSDFKEKFVGKKHPGLNGGGK